MADASFCPDSTRPGRLPPWEIAKAFAFSQVLKQVAERLGSTPSELVDMRVDDYIASQLQVKGGGCPSGRAVRDVVKKCESSHWYPGKIECVENRGRKPAITERQKNEVARVAMSLKRERIAPDPRRVRARLPDITINRETGKPISKYSMQQIYTTKCYDESEDDPWVYLSCVSQDTLPSETEPLRVKACEWILKNTTETSWYQHVAFDPNYTLIATTLAKQEELQIAAMGSSRWMSKESKRVSINMRAPATARTQSSNNSVTVHWTPVFARGCVKIFVVDPTKAIDDPLNYPSKLNDSALRLEM